MSKIHDIKSTIRVLCVQQNYIHDHLIFSDEDKIGESTGAEHFALLRRKRGPHFYKGPYGGSRYPSYGYGGRHYGHYGGGYKGTFGGSRYPSYGYGGGYRRHRYGYRG